SAGAHRFRPALVLGPLACGCDREPMTTARPLNDFTQAELGEALVEKGVRAWLVGRIYRCIHSRGPGARPDFGTVRGLSHEDVRTLAQSEPGRTEVVTRRRAAADGFVKYLFRLHDGRQVEAVAIPLPAGPDTVPEKYVVCVSSQAGCALACAFCATGRM